ncbi:MAG: hypothetical protein AAF797_10650 [Planctomycetota bacterium]
MPHLHLSLTALLCFASASCSSYSLPNRHTDRTISTTELIGTWKLTADSLALLTRDGFASNPAHTYTITFDPGGTLLFSSVMADFQSGVYTTANGSWRLEHRKPGDPSGTPTNTLVIEIQQTSLDRFVAYSFAEENGSLVIWRFYGDPDLWEFMQYEKIR